MDKSGKASDTHRAEKRSFHAALSAFAGTLEKHIAIDGEWTVKGFIDIFKNVHALSSDTKVLSKILEIHLFPHFLDFAHRTGYTVELATHQNRYPDMTFIKTADSRIKFAVDIKTTYTDEKHPGSCNGFTLGSHGEYFTNRDSSKNIQYPYSEYAGHFCLGIIYSRVALPSEWETRTYSLDELSGIPSVIRHFTFFAAEKWRIASDKGGSGNTANIGSIKRIEDILAGNGVFANAGEDVFDDYWANFGKILITAKDGGRKPMTSFDEYLTYRGLPPEMRNSSVQSRRAKT